METMNTALVLLLKALATLKEAFDVFLDIQKLGNLKFILAAEDSMVQRFEYTHEAFWKFLKRYLEKIYNLEAVNSPRSVFRACFKVGLCSEAETDLLLMMLDKRNQTTHIYDSILVHKILPEVPMYYDCMKKIAERVKADLENRKQLSGYQAE